MGGEGRGRSAWLRTASLAALACAAASSAMAQTPPPTPAPVAPADGTATFPAEFFKQYNPVSAADMVARVPGFELRDGDERRGFGATAGNLLVNGERPSSKTAASELLKRIPAGNVVRIEVLSGSSAAADVRGQSQIVNVVLRQAAKREITTTYVLGARYLQYANRVGWATQLSSSIPLAANADLAIDIQSPNTLGRSENYDVLITGGVPTGQRILISRGNNKGLQTSANLRWRPTSSDAVNVNLQIYPLWNESTSSQVEAATSGAVRSTLRGLSDFDNNYTAELGGDWEHTFSSALSVKLIALISNGSVDQHDTFETFTAPSLNVTRTQDRTTRNGERIGRARLKWTANAAHTLEFGAEGAFNFRDTTLDIVNMPRGGAPIPVPLAVSDARVEEIRGEVFVADIWTLTPKLTVESGLNVEFSRISQTGDQEKERRFRYFKPRISATYTLSERSTLRASLTRDVSQLDFAEFSSAVDFVNASSTQGNPDLVPEKAWKSRVEWENRFAARAALTIAAFYDRVDDVRDLVDLNGFDAYGNIGRGSRTGVEVRAQVPLEPLGLKNAELRLNGLYQRTRVTDPITGEKRSFSVPIERQGSPFGAPVLNAGNKDWAYVVNFRQNLPAIRSAFGFTAVQWAGREEYRRAEITEFVRHEPRIDVFFETTAIGAVTARVFVNNILSTEEDRTRSFFLRDRSSGTVQRVELRRVDGGPEGSRIYGFQFSGRF